MHCQRVPVMTPQAPQPHRPAPAGESRPRTAHSRIPMARLCRAPIPNRHVSACSSRSPVSACLRFSYSATSGSSLLVSRTMCTCAEEWPTLATNIFFSMWHSMGAAVLTPKHQLGWVEHKLAGPHAPRIGRPCRFGAASPPPWLPHCRHWTGSALVVGGRWQPGKGVE